MKLKRVLSGLMAAAILSTLLVIVPVSAAKLTAFTDITDPATAEAAEILRVLGIVSGTGSGAFLPESSLDRAAFCKMTVELMGNGNLVAGQSNRTIFQDVPSTHWARGYINVATQGSTSGSGETATSTPGIIRGDAYGNFNPNRPITYAESITILMRVLGYQDSDVGFGSAWYSGYLSTAQSVKLTDGLTVVADRNITRGQAALLFRNLLFTKSKGSESVYLTHLGGSVKDNAIILSTNATAADGTTGSVQTSLETYRTDRVSFPAELNGTRGEIALDKDAKIIAVLPRKTDSFKRITLSGNNANYVTGTDGVRIDLDSTVAVWKNGEATTYDKVWSTLKAGTSLVLCYNAGGKNDYVYVSDAATATDVSALVLKSAPSGNPFAALGSPSAALYKNGMAVTTADLRQYDVGVLDRSSNTVQISDRRLTGVYENAYPNTTAPSTIRLMGYDFPVLPSAVADLQSFKIGASMTLLLTHDNRVAGVVTTAAATGTAVGIAEVTKGSSKVTLFDGAITLSGKNSLSETAAAALDGKLVTVSSGQKGYLTLSEITGSGTNTSIDLTAGTMGTRKLADNVQFYDCIDGGAVIKVDREDIALSKIPASKISFVSLDYAGRVSYAVLNDFTGDGYQYGYFFYETETHSGTNIDGTSFTYDLHYISVRQGKENGDEVKTARTQTTAAIRTGIPGGLAISGSGKVVSHVELQSLRGVARSAFDVDAMTATTTDNIYPIADQVQCYNKTTGQWYAPGETGITAVIGFSDTLTVYFDKAPTQGGKIRMIVTE